MFNYKILPSIYPHKQLQLTLANTTKTSHTVSWKHNMHVYVSKHKKYTYNNETIPQKPQL